MNYLEEAKGHLNLIFEAYEEGLTEDSTYTEEDITINATAALAFAVVALVERLDNLTADFGTLNDRDALRIIAVKEK